VTRRRTFASGAGTRRSRDGALTHCSSRCIAARVPGECLIGNSRVLRRRLRSCGVHELQEDPPTIAGAWSARQGSDPGGGRRATGLPRIQPPFRDGHRGRLPLFPHKGGDRIRDEDVARIDGNQQSTAGRAAGARRLPLRLRDQPRRRHSATLLVWTIFDSDGERLPETPAFPAERKYDLAGACWDSADPRCRLGRKGAELAAACRRR